MTCKLETKEELFHVACNNCLYFTFARYFSGCTSYCSAKKLAFLIKASGRMFRESVLPSFEDGGDDLGLVDVNSLELVVLLSSVELYPSWLKLNSMGLLMEVLNSQIRGAQTLAQIQSLGRLWLVWMNCPSWPAVSTRQ